MDAAEDDDLELAITLFINFITSAPSRERTGACRGATRHLRRQDDTAEDQAMELVGGARHDAARRRLCQAGVGTTTTRSSTLCSPPSTSSRWRDAFRDGDPEFAVTLFAHFIEPVT